MDATYGSRSKSTRGFAWLFSAISTIRITQCSDPRDKVYAALSIANYLMGRHIRNFIVPNYSASVADVFTEVTKIIIENSESINFLPFAEIEPLSLPPGLPTWVPDYSTSVTVTALPLFRGFSHFDASLSRVSRDFNFSILGRYLTLQGARFDEINEVCGLATPEWASKHEFHVVLKLCWSLVESPSGESRRRRCGGRF